MSQKWQVTVWSSPAWESAGAVLRQRSWVIGQRGWNRQRCPSRKGDRRSHPPPYRQSGSGAWLPDLVEPPGWPFSLASPRSGDILMDRRPTGASAGDPGGPCESAFGLGSRCQARCGRFNVFACTQVRSHTGRCPRRSRLTSRSRSSGCCQTPRGSSCSTRCSTASCR